MTEGVKAKLDALPLEKLCIRYREVIEGQGLSIKRMQEDLRKARHRANENERKYHAELHECQRKVKECDEAREEVEKLKAVVEQLKRERDFLNIKIARMKEGGE